MTKDKTIFVCSSCGNEASQWMGRCSSCGEWNTLKEFKMQKAKGKSNERYDNKPREAIDLDKIETKDFCRISTKIGEFDRVLGGENSKAGIVPGSLILLGGDPGIGKSTLLLQAAGKIDGVFYISGEESSEQIKLRANRLSVNSSNFKILSASDVDFIIEQITKLHSEGFTFDSSRPSHPIPSLDKISGSVNRHSAESKSLASSSKNILVIIDSIQTMYDSNYPSTPGSIVQVRECALRFQQLAKSLHIPIILVGHVTKDGSIAGPRILEHLVDVVLYLEGERYHNNRILRSIKNRYGATDEIGIFEMKEDGMVEVKNPSQIFLAERLKGTPGSIITATVEGTRPFLVEIQALTSPTTFGFPRRTSSGFDLNRLQLLIAVLAKRAGINLNNQDVYLNIAGGFKIKEPAADLAICMALASVYKNKPVDPDLCLFGEVGLSGEIRSVNHQEKRTKEAERLGFKTDAKSKTLFEAIKRIM